jgi:xylan 1,4-beta-xylosidase
MAMGGIKKPSYTGFAVLHKLGRERIPNDAPNVLVTRGVDGKLIIAAWNLVDPDRKGSPQSIEFHVTGVAANAAVGLTHADDEHGDTLAAYKQMGSSKYPTRAQVNRLSRVADEVKPENSHLTGGIISLEIPVNGIVVLEFK